MRILLLTLLMLSITGCAGKNSLNDIRVSLRFVSAYDAAVGEFKQGQVMEARERLLSVKKDDEDYKTSRLFLREKVEPARLKLLRHYARKGKKERDLRHWAKSEEAFETAAGLSTQPKALERYQAEMNLKVRQVRVDAIYVQREAEDQSWLKWQKNYMSPLGLFGDDESFVITRKFRDDALDMRVKETWSLAKKFEIMDMPEMAWLYADAYLRLSPSVKKAHDLKNAMATALPKGFKLPRSSSKNAVGRSVTPNEPVITKITSVKHVKKLMEKRDWLKAKSEAQVLRKQGNANADKLLKKINAEIQVLAENVYAKGNLAFRAEKIDQAVEFWQQAVNWMPSEQVYLDSLRRGKQIQERLNALKVETEEE